MTLAPLRAAEPDPWASGWDMLVALGTLGLALGTVLLAGFTLALARRTRDLARDSETALRSQWRPVLLPATERPPEGSEWSLTGGVSMRMPVTYLTYDSAAQVLAVRIHNAGTGPALYVRVHLERPEEPGGISPRNWSRAALAPGEAVDLLFDNAAFADRAQLLMDYRDLAGDPHGTACTIERVNLEPGMYDVQVLGHSVTTLGDAVYPQEGLRDVRKK
ncbi:hypothetical protein OG864_00520 [Streptomyces sp. NBC_00124]|uniref:hypothetical protein n=1 Tax=Streptomyces sp. NBC_00124 TaxID=2975662 RepID=UPI0022514DC4|nr:hypothetical protein [Streptomyces sp. NBC_00124]MCX5357269.1 hypothetical protein [Streptomyces sp. NBC_00124]